MNLHRSSHAQRTRSDNEVPVPDALSQVLQDLRLAGVHYCRCEVAAPWGIELPARPESTFHYVIEGRCWLQSSRTEPSLLTAGDIVLLPQGTGHRLLAQPGAKSSRIDALGAQRLGDLTYRLRTGGEGPRSLLVCCAVRFDEPRVHPLLELMPQVLIVRARTTRDPALVALLGAMASEGREERIGAATVMTRLADSIVARVVRDWVESHPENTSGWLAAIREPKIGRALAAFHREPDGDWNVEALASVAGMSRSIFSERFASVLGVSPAKYVVRWRMHLAARWLRTEQRTVDQVAVHLGYESVASFSRTFKRVMGAPPVVYRQSAGEDWRWPLSDETRTIPDELSWMPTRAGR
jgi:AraC-like DNA-binding protein